MAEGLLEPALPQRVRKLKEMSSRKESGSKQLWIELFDTVKISPLLALQDRCVYSESISYTTNIVNSDSSPRAAGVSRPVEPGRSWYHPLPGLPHHRPRGLCGKSTVAGSRMRESGESGPDHPTRPYRGREMPLRHSRVNDQGGQFWPVH